VQRELKGVTYHDLTVRRRGGGWYARVVFDL
jgi:SHS2 domain-containing protein